VPGAGQAGVSDTTDSGSEPTRRGGGVRDMGDVIEVPIIEEELVKRSVVKAWRAKYTAGRRRAVSENQGMGGNTSDQQFREGTSVFDAGGQTVGVVKEYNPQGNYLLVQRGWAFSQDAYVPLDAIGDTGASGIYLKLNRDALVQQSWDRPPASAAALGPEASAEKDIQPATVEGRGFPPAHGAADKTEELREEIEQTRAGLSETIDASPEPLVGQARERIRGRTKPLAGQARERIRGRSEHLAGQARERIRGATVGKVGQVAPGVGDTAKKVASSASDMAKKVVSSGRDRAKGGVSIMTDSSQTVEQNGQTQRAGTSLFAGGLSGWSVGMATGLAIGLVAGLFLGLLINNTARSSAMARAALPKNVAPRPLRMVWRRPRKASKVSCKKARLSWLKAGRILTVTRSPSRHRPVARIYSSAVQLARLRR
jgi:hypothetical protein